MNRTSTHWILLLLTLTISAALLHEVVNHDNTTCTVCVQFHGTPPVIANGETGISVDFLTVQASQPITQEQSVPVRPYQNRTIRAPPQVLKTS